MAGGELDHISDGLANGSTAWLSKSDYFAAGFGQALGQALDLCGFAATFDTFKCDKQAVHFRTGLFFTATVRRVFNSRGKIRGEVSDECPDLAVVKIAAVLFCEGRHQAVRFAIGDPLLPVFLVLALGQAAEICDEWRPVFGFVANPAGRRVKLLAAFSNCRDDMALDALAP